MMRVLGIILLVVGLAGLALGTFEYTRKKRVVDWGPLQVETKQKESVTIPPLAAGGAAAAGLVLILIGSRRR
jgi:hypothetical protein